MIRKAIADMRTVTKLVSDSTQAFLDVSLMYYAVGDVEESLGLELRIIILIIFFANHHFFFQKRLQILCPDPRNSRYEVPVGRILKFSGLGHWMVNGDCFFSKLSSKFEY